MADTLLRAFVRCAGAQTNAVGVVVGIELLLILIWFVLTLVQFVLMFRALAKGRGRLALMSALWLSLGALLWFVGMGLGPALIYVT